MQPAMVDWLGYVAAVLTTTAFVPQALKTIRTRDTRGISLRMYVLFTAGIVLWFAYGVALGSWPIMLANVATLLPAVTIVVLKIRHG